MEGRLGSMVRGRARNLARKSGDTIPNSIEFRSCPPISSDRAYYNTGSCVHPRCITGLEITPGKEGNSALSLIKWGYAAQGAGRTMAIEREELEK
jgi:hypothetical protein